MTTDALSVEFIAIKSSLLEFCGKERQQHTGEPLRGIEPSYDRLRDRIFKKDALQEEEPSEPKREGQPPGYRKVTHHVEPCQSIRPER